MQTQAMRGRELFDERFTVLQSTPKTALRHTKSTMNRTQYKLMRKNMLRDKDSGR